MSTEIRNWDLVAKAMEAAGSTSSQMYIRAKALAEGKPDPMPTSFPQAPHSISAVAGWYEGPTDKPLNLIYTKHEWLTTSQFEFVQFDDPWDDSHHS